MESLVKDAIITHMEKNKLIADQQHGFIAGRSCTTQLISTLEDWTKILDDGECVDAIYMDLKKAFDSVPHQRLLAKLKGYGIKGKLLKWIETFLTFRKHCVLVNGAASSWTEVVSGVPQGSVLGPILFILYINDLTNVVICDMKIFADDTKIYHKTSTRQDPCVHAGQRQDLPRNCAIHLTIRSRGLDSVQTTGEKAACLHDATSVFDHEANLEGQSDKQGNTRSDRAALYGRSSDQKESPMDWTPHEDVIRQATKADPLFSIVFWSQTERTPSSSVQGYHQEKPQAERHKDRLMDITLTAEN